MPEILTAKHVTEIFDTCLFQKNEPTHDYILVEGIKAQFGFHPGRIKENTEAITEMLNELPDKFKETSGGGWSFVNACEDKHGNLWTGLQQIMEQLFVIGIAAGRAKWLLPRDMWYSLPGGMPYVVILDKGVEDA